MQDFATFASGNWRLSGLSGGVVLGLGVWLGPSRPLIHQRVAEEDCASIRLLYPQLRQWQCRIPAWQAGRDREDVWPRNEYATGRAAILGYENSN